MRTSYNGKPIQWDRPNTGIYPDGTIRIFEKNSKGDISYARPATDEEVRFIMMYELIASKQP